jgi:tight adherence protein B
VTNRARAAVLRIAASAAVALALPGASASAAALSGSLGNGAKFPARTLVLSAPAGIRVSVPHMYIWENGGPVDYLTATPLTQASTGDFGVELVIDQSASMRGAPLAHALAAARAFAAQRTGKQELGVIAFSSAPTTVLPLTSDPRAINQVLAATPWTGTGTKILPAVSLALKQLKAAKIADGAVIVLSDGASAGTGGMPAVVSAAQSQHVPIFTVGLRDRTFSPGLLRALAQQGGGKYVAATGAQLPNVFKSIAASLTQSYLIRYRSIVPGGRHIAVKVRVDGVPTLLRFGYYAPAPLTGVAPLAGTRGAAPARTPSHGGTPPDAATPPAGGAQAPPGHRLAPLPTFGVTIAGWKPTVPRRSFWTSSLGELAVAGGCALLIGLAIAILLYRHPARRALQRRVGDFIVAGHGELDAAAPPEGIVAKLVTHRRKWPEFVELVQTARIRRTPLALVKRSLVGVALVACVLVYLTGTIVFGILVVVAAPFLLRAWVAHVARKQRKLFAEQLPSNLQDLAGAMRAGRSFVGAISAVAETSIEPIRGELERAMTDEKLGLPLEDTLSAIARRMNAKDMDQIALIAALNRSSGSNVAEALERVAEGSRERADLAREIRSLTGQARMSNWVLSSLPPAMLAALSVIAPQYSHPLFHTTMGIVLLVVAAGMVVSGWLVMKRITNPDV